MSRPAPAQPAPTTPVQPPATPVERGVSSWAVAWRQLKRDKTAMFAGASLVVLALMALLSPVIANSKPLLCSYKGRWFMPAFKDYLDENIPIPFGIPAWMRRTFPGAFSPAYPDAPELIRPGNALLPDWRRMCREIDSSTGKDRGDWYVRAPIPYYYKETSSAIKQLPFSDIVHLELTDGPFAGTAVELAPNAPWKELVPRMRARDPALALDTIAVIHTALSPGEDPVWLVQRASSDAPPSSIDGQPLGDTPTRLAEGQTLKVGERTLHVTRPPVHALGTDQDGRDVASRILHGTVIAGSVGVVSVSIYVIIGVILGALAGYFRGWVDILLSRVIEVVICFPTFFLILSIVALFDPSIYNIMIALGLINWTGVARLVRGEFLKAMSEDYVQAARALGFGHTRIIFRHILPNAIAPVFVSASFGVAGAILTESSLSFLGFGVAPPTASWGEILGQGRRYIQEDLWHLVWVPGACIFYTVTMFNLLGEGLRDALDPKLRQ